MIYPPDLSVVDLDGGQVTQNIFDHYERQLFRFTFSECASMIATTASYDHEACLWDIASQRKRHSFVSRGQNLRYNDIAFSPDGRLTAAASQDGYMRVWSTQTGGLVYTSPKQSTSVKRVLFSPNGDFVASFTNKKSGIGSGTASHDNLIRLVPTDQMG